MPLIAIAIALISLAVLATPIDGPSGRSSFPVISSPKPAPDPLVRRRVYLGRSVRGRSIYAVEIGDPDNERRTLVVGVIHGDESAGVPIARGLAAHPVPKERLLWVIKDLNPDGLAAGTRQNANGVDLNRNFPWRWRPLGVRGDLQYSGPRPLSEPESRIARSLILRVRPQVTVWFHQPLGVVDESGGSLGVERRFSRLSGLPLERLVRYPGSAAGWQNHRLPHSTGFVVELPRGSPSPRRASRYVRATLKLTPPSHDRSEVHRPAAGAGA
ncbi:MAG: murein peptide amidase [Solirubrobacterales bacterium]|jgi:protein MpaA|nr:murein peptide amidase [Solirubrobacterales bacterium]